MCGECLCRWFKRSGVACATLSGVILLLLTSCVGERGLELCRLVQIKYRYVRTSVDEYAQHIGSERRYLFDAEGTFIEEIPVDPDNRQVVTLRDIPEGEYQILALGNFTDTYTSLTSLQRGVTKLADVQLALMRQLPNHEGAFASSEELFWSLRTIQCRLLEPQSYICDMANIHCHLYLQVVWEGQPPREGSETFTLRLSGVATDYEMQVDSARSLQIAGVAPTPRLSSPSYVLHDFPRFGYPPGVVDAETSLRGEALFFSICTFRLTDEAMPTVNVIHDGKALFNTPISLAQVFHQWHWIADIDPEQVYSLKLRIRLDGTVDVLHGIATISDWADGGTFGFS